MSQERSIAHAKNEKRGADKKVKRIMEGGRAHWWALFEASEKRRVKKRVWKGTKKWYQGRTETHTKATAERKKTEKLHFTL